MKKFLIVMVTLISVLCCALGFTACGDNGNTGDNGDNTHTSHNWSKTYTPDGDRHYQTCDGCDEKQYSDHDYGTNGVCVCGKNKPVEAHTSHNWSKTYTPDGDQHYQTCDGCDEKKYSDHSYGADDTCVCGKEKPTTTVEAIGVTLDKTEIELEIGDTGTLTATVAPDNATDKSVTFTVEPAGVVSVDNDGNVTAIDEGTAVITATTSNGKTATCNVTVIAPLTNADVLKFLNDNLTNEVAKKFAQDNFFTFNANDVSNVTWYVTKDGEKITGANIVFTYRENATFKAVVLYNVSFSAPLTPQDILNNEVGTSTYTKIYSNFYNYNIQDEHSDLTNAICDKLFGTNANITRYIIDKGFVAADPQLGDISTFTVIEVTDTVIKQKSIAIAYANSDAGLIEKLSNIANYYTYDNDISQVITGTKLENNNEKF